MSVTKTFTVTVSGGVFLIDGVVKATVELARGATYRFDDSDSSVAGHPLAFSTTSDGTHAGGTYYNTGTTRNNSPGQSGAYIEIAVAEDAPSQLYYFCQNHSGMGGSINVTASSWGALRWNYNSWGTDVNTISVDGFPLSIAQGNTLGYPEQGWGGGEYGEQAYGSLPDGGVVADSLTLTSNTGSVNIETFTDVAVTGNSASLGIGSAEVDIVNNGWGASTWGSTAWGETGNVILTGQGLTIAEPTVVASIDVDVAVGSLSMQSVLEVVTQRTDAEIEAEGNSATFAVGLNSVRNDVDVPIFENGISMVAEVGQETEAYPRSGWGRLGWGTADWGEDENEIVQVQGFGLTIANNLSGVSSFTDVTVETNNFEIQTLIGSEQIEVDVTLTVDGQGLSTAIGEETAFTDVVVVPSGPVMSTTVGVAEAGLLTEVPVTGVTASFVAGQAEADDASAETTGVTATASVGSVNITAWSEVDRGTTVSWSDVDLAA